MNARMIGLAGSSDPFRPSFYYGSFIKGAIA